MRIPPEHVSAPASSEADDAFASVSPYAGERTRPPETPRPFVRNYLVESIIVTICCCWPFGVVAIVFAAQVNSRVAMGDFAGAQSASNNARTFCIVSLVLGIITGILNLIIYVPAYITALSSGFQP
jgi:hypothetical protein